MSIATGLTQMKAEPPDCLPENGPITLFDGGQLTPYTADCRMPPGWPEAHICMIWLLLPCIRHVVLRAHFQRSFLSNTAVRLGGWRNHAYAVTSRWKPIKCV
eukprot:scaffold200934_cov20-Prasinocladus_malaysianus.AAC.1